MWQIARRVFRKPTHESKVDLSWGATLTVPPQTRHLLSYSSGFYEVEMTRLVGELDLAGSTVLDLGASIGYYTVMFSKMVGDAGHVCSFEPLPDWIRYLEMNVAANDCSNVTVFKQAVGAAPGALRFRRDGEASYLGDNGDIDVSVTTIDEALASGDWPPVTFVKMDVEGAERAVLEGARNLCTGQPLPIIVLELNWDAMSRAGETWESLTETLRSLGYEVGYLLEKGMQEIALNEPFTHPMSLYNMAVGLKR